MKENCTEPGEKMSKLAGEYFPKEKPPNYKKGAIAEHCSICRYYEDRKCTACDFQIVGRLRVCDCFDQE